MLSPSETSAIAGYLSNKTNSVKTYPFEKTLAVYTVKDTAFAYLETGKQTLRLSLRTDPELSKLLLEKYEEVARGHKLDPKRWVTIVISGQLSFDEITALIDHSYNLALAEVQT